MILIAELCQNHNGDFDLLKKMVYSAKESGADFVKIQTIFADMLAFRERFEEGIVEGGVTKSIKRPYKEEYDRLKKLELTFKQQKEFIRICHELDIKPLTTAFTCDSIDKIKSLFLLLMHNYQYKILTLWFCLFAFEKVLYIRYVFYERQAHGYFFYNCIRLFNIIFFRNIQIFKKQM